MGRIQGDLLERTFQFSLMILSFMDRLPHSTKGWLVAKQLGRSGTSIGANLCEANFAFSTIDFAHKCNISLKEGSESNYWLRLCKADELLVGDDVDAAIHEADELIRILSTIVRKTQSPNAS